MQVQREFLLASDTLVEIYGFESQTYSCSHHIVLPITPGLFPGFISNLQVVLNASRTPALRIPDFVIVTSSFSTEYWNSFFIGSNISDSCHLSYRCPVWHTITMCYPFPGIVRFNYFCYIANTWSKITLKRNQSVEAL